MKRQNVLLVLLANVIITASVCAQEKTQETVYIHTVRFATPLLQKWADEYSRSHPRMQIAITEDKNAGADLHVSIVTGEESHHAIAVGRYAILPVAGKNSTLLADIQKKKLNGKRLRELYFEKDVTDDDYEPEKESKYNATVYAGNSLQSVAAAFADHFGFAARSLRGKKIAGDDIYLNSAIQKDNTGVSFNSLNYLFDVQTRKLKEGIAILPLEIRKEYSETLAESDLDKTIELLESRKIDLIPVKELVLEVKDGNNPEIKQFIRWITSEGQRYNHTFGFLKLNDSRLASK